MNLRPPGPQTGIGTSARPLEAHPAFQGRDRGRGRAEHHVPRAQAHIRDAHGGRRRATAHDSAVAWPCRREDDSGLRALPAEQSRGRVGRRGLLLTADRPRPPAEPARGLPHRDPVLMVQRSSSSPSTRRRPGSAAGRDRRRFQPSLPRGKGVNLISERPGPPDPAEDKRGLWSCERVRCRTRTGRQDASEMRRHAL